MIKDRHLAVAETIIEGIAPDQAPCFQVVRSCERALNDAGLDTPSWREMSESLPRRESQPEPNGPKFGWQHAANMSLEEAVPYNTLGTVATTRQGTHEIPAWTTGFCSSYSSADLQGDTD